jgi:hypothetical protein
MQAINLYINTDFCVCVRVNSRQKVTERLSALSATDNMCHAQALSEAERLAYSAEGDGRVDKRAPSLG